MNQKHFEQGLQMSGFTRSQVEAVLPHAKEITADFNRRGGKVQDLQSALRANLTGEKKRLGDLLASRAGLILDQVAAVKSGQATGAPAENKGEKA